jgi:hypothetical protein
MNRRIVCSQIARQEVVLLSIYQLSYRQSNGLFAHHASEVRSQ